MLIFNHSNFIHLLISLINFLEFFFNCNTSSRKRALIGRQYKQSEMTNISSFILLSTTKWPNSVEFSKIGIFGYYTNLLKPIIYIIWIYEKKSFQPSLIILKKLVFDTTELRIKKFYSNFFLMNIFENFSPSLMIFWLL